MFARPGTTRKREKTQTMSGIISPPSTSTLAASQMYPAQAESHAAFPPGQDLQQPMVIIKGEIGLRVTESEAARQPTIGRYHIETEGLQEPLHLLWYAEGKVLHPQARSTAIAFDLRGTPAGHAHLPGSSPGCRERCARPRGAKWYFRAN